MSMLIISTQSHVSSLSIIEQSVLRLLSADLSPSSPRSAVHRRASASKRPHTSSSAVRPYIFTQLDACKNMLGAILSHCPVLDENVLRSSRGHLSRDVHLTEPKPCTGKNNLYIARNTALITCMLNHCPEC